MKVIDLLNKIANNELPKDVKLYDKDLSSGYSDEYLFNCKDFEVIGNIYENPELLKEGSVGIDLGICDLNDLYTFLCDGDIDLNDEIEIIEEDKPIKKLKLYTNYEILEDNIRTTREICFKINEIIDRLNELKKKESDK